MSQHSEISASRVRKYQKYSLRQKEIFIKQIYEEGKTIKEAADIAGIGLSGAKYILQQYKKNEENIVERPRGGKRKEKLTDNVLSKIERLVETNPTITLKEIQRLLRDQEDLRVSIQTISNGMKKLMITRKMGYCEIERVNAPVTIEQRKSFAAFFTRNSPNDHCKWVFIDESGFNLHLRRSFARSRRGTRATVVLPTVRGRNVTLIAAISTAGVLCSNVIANSTCNSQKFCIFLRELLNILTERENMEGTWLIMDNARIHKTQEVRDLVSSSPFTLQFLPPYSPMINPIEQAFSKIKASVRRDLSSPTHEGDTLVNVINRAVGAITSTDCSNYVMHMLSNMTKAAAGEQLR